MCSFVFAELKTEADLTKARDNVSIDILTRTVKFGP
jgi:hypothetical protein